LNLGWLLDLISQPDYFFYQYIEILPPAAVVGVGYMQGKFS
jgi:hypothetical protein